MLAFCNLFRLTEGTDFTINNPEDAIFSQGRDYMKKSAATAAETVVEEETATVEFDDDSSSSICGW